MTKGQQFYLDGFISFHNAYSDPEIKHPGGGISCFISSSVQKYIDNVDIDSENFIKVIVKGGHTSFGNYVPPSDSIFLMTPVLPTCVMHFFPKF